MAVHTWVAIVLTALLLTAMVAFCAGWAAHAEYRHRYHMGRQMARELESAGARRGGQPPSAATVVCVHLPPTITPIWAQPPIINQHIPMIEGVTYEQD